MPIAAWAEGFRRSSSAQALAAGSQTAASHDEHDRKPPRRASATSARPAPRPPTTPPAMLPGLNLAPPRRLPPAPRLSPPPPGLLNSVSALIAQQDSGAGRAPAGRKRVEKRRASQKQIEAENPAASRWGSPQIMQMRSETQVTAAALGASETASTGSSAGPLAGRSAALGY